MNCWAVVVVSSMFKEPLIAPSGCPYGQVFLLGFWMVAVASPLEGLAIAPSGCPYRQVSL